MGAFIGNNAAAAFLRNALAAGMGAHAYLLTGPSQIGKCTLAKRAAATLVCTSRPEARPCGACRSCDLVERDAHSDVRLTAPPEGGRRVLIAQIRQLEHEVALRPYEAERKVAIVDGADTIVVEAANALLKTLEEPPEDTVLFLTASDVSQVLPTIASRCQEVPLRPVPASEIESALLDLGCDAAHARLLARLAAGRPGWALAALENAAPLETRQQQLDLLEDLMARPAVARLSAGGSFPDTAAARSALDTWQTWWRDALYVREGCADLVVNVDRMEALQSVGASAADCWRAVRRVQDAREQLDANANVRLAIESLLLELPASASTAAAAIR
ncbi:MAG: DNA polymerase III subunit delta' [Chloroflexota bacterium]